MATILLMEDCALQAMMVADWLEMEGHELSVAHDKAQAMDRLGEMDSIDLVVTDIFGSEQTSEAEGLELIAAIRSSQDTQLKDTPIISISGVSLEAAISQAENESYNGDELSVSDLHFTKPINLEQFSEAISVLTASSEVRAHQQG